MEKIVAFAIPMVLTFLVTVVVCRMRVGRKLPVSFGTVLFSVFLVTSCWLGFTTQGEIYTVGFWRGSIPKPPDRELMLKVVAFMLLTCALPALGVVYHYQQRTKKHGRLA